MKPKQLLIMAIILVVLAVVGVMVTRPPKQESIAVQARLVSIMPDSLLPESVVGIEFVMNKKTEVKLEKAAGKWRISSAWNAPAKAEKIEKLLKQLKNMKGEFASENPKLQEKYGVDEKTGVHIRLYTAASDKPALDLVMGKNRGYSSTFVRLAADKTVYDTGDNLRSLFDMWGNDAKPKRDAWLNKNIIKVEKEKLKQVELRYPDHTLVFVKQEKSRPGDKEKQSAGGKKEYEWRLTSGGPGVDFKKEKFKSLLGTIASIDIRDVQDPAKKKELGLDKPPYALTLILDDDKKIELVGVGKPDDTGEAYVMQPGKSGLIFSMAPWTLGEIFPKGKDLFELDTPNVEKEKVTRLTIARDQNAIVMTRKDGNADWTLVSPDTGFTFRKSVAQDIVDKLADWKAEDFADADGLVKYRLNTPACMLKAGLAGGKERTFMLGAAHPTLKGAYVAENTKSILVMSKSDREKVFPESGKFFELQSLLNVKEDDIVRVSLQRQGDAGLVLERREKPAKPEKPSKAKKKDDKGKDDSAPAEAYWMLRHAGKEVIADKSKVQGVLSALAGLEAKDLLLGDAANKVFPADKTATVRIKLAKGEVMLKIGAPVNGRGCAALASNRKAAVLIAEDDVGRILVKAADLLPAQVKKPASEKKKTETDRSKTGKAPENAKLLLPAKNK